MPKLITEQAHLAEADRHIAEGEQRVTGQALLIERLRAARQDMAAAEALLLNLQNTLRAWNAHRDEILREIARVEASSSH